MEQNTCASFKNCDHYSKNDCTKLMVCADYETVKNTALSFFMQIPVSLNKKGTNWIDTKLVRFIIDHQRKTVYRINGREAHSSRKRGQRAII